MYVYSTFKDSVTFKKNIFFTNSLPFEAEDIPYSRVKNREEVVPGPYKTGLHALALDGSEEAW